LTPSPSLGAFTIPHAFVALFSERRFDYWGAPYATLTENARAERLRVHRDRVLWLRTIEWDRHPDDLAMTDGADGHLRPGFVPFAGNGYGDSYCWYPRWQSSAPEPPVLFVPHDELFARVFARSFGECVLRCLLQDHAIWDVELDGAESLRRSLFSAHAGIIRPHLDDSTRARLASVGDSPTPAACDAMDEAIARALDPRTLVGMMQPVRYDEEYLRGADLLAAYERSLAFYRELVESEGREQLRRELDQVRQRVTELRSE
jgi:hypothetical protein